MWQENTKKQILDQLLCKTHKYKELGSRDEKLVTVFGKSHAGKTTLILTLMGILEDKLKEVNSILRAGIPEGCSSTSTAMIYQISDDDMFGISESEINALSDDAIVKCNKEMFVSNLARIRQMVEQGERKTNKVLYIYIPKCYFELDNNDKTIISILDVPGFETNNFKEKQHTNALLRKYMTISSLNIVVRSIYDINDLRYFKAPNGDDFSKLLSDRYIVVITRSYSPENIFRFFTVEKKQRNTTFAEMLDEECKEQFGRIFGNDIPKYFPVDIGDSFNELVNIKISDEEDRKYVVEYRKRIFGQILECIKSKQSRTLKSWVNEIREDENFYINRKRKEMLIQVDEVEAKICSLKKEIENIEDEKCNIENILKSSETILNELKMNKKSIDVPKPQKIADEKTQKLVKDNFNEKYKWINNNNTKNVADLFAKAFRDAVDSFVSELESKDTDMFSELIKTKVLLDIDSYETDLHTELDNEMNAHKILKILNPNNKDKIDIGRKKLEEAIETCILKIYCQSMQIYDERIRVQQSACNKVKMLIKDVDIRSKESRNKLYGLLKEKEEIENQIQIVNDRIIKDQDILEGYRTIATENYIREKKRIVKLMNEEGSKEKKCEYAILLALIQKDYKKIMMR